MVLLEDDRVVFLFRHDLLHGLMWHRSPITRNAALIFAECPETPRGFRLAMNIHRRWEYVPKERKAAILAQWPSFRCEIRAVGQRRIRWRAMLSPEDYVLMRLANRPMNTAS